MNQVTFVVDSSVREPIRRLLSAGLSSSTASKKVMWMQRAADQLAGAFPLPGHQALRDLRLRDWRKPITLGRSPTVVSKFKVLERYFGGE